MNGFGRVFKRHRIWWIAYSRGGKEFRESARSTKRSDALALLRKRNEERIVSGRVLLSQIFHERIADAKLRGICSIRHLMLYHRRFMNFFGNIVARDLGTCDVRRYQAARKQQGAAGGTVNREVSALKRALRLAVESRLLDHCPVFPQRLAESEPRQGFFEHDDYLAIRDELAPWAQDILDFAYYTGWRRSEILGLEWGEVFEDSIRLNPKRVKTRRPRLRPITEDLAPIIARRTRERVFSCLYVFHRNGKRIPTATWQVHWTKARERAGRLHILLHDARRTVVRNLIRAGVRERVAMEMTGHVSRRIFDRYHIIREDDLEEAGQKLKDYLDTKECEGKIVPLFPRKERKRS